MRVLYYLGCLLLVSTSMKTVQAYYNSSLNTDHIEYTTKTKPIAKPKLSTISSAGIKLASVNFIAKTDTGRNFKGKDVSNSCTGYPYTTEMAVANCASVSICRDGHLQKIKCTSCKNNMTLGTDGRCKCNQSIYKYSITGSATGGSSCTYGYDEDNKCQEIDSGGALKTYYADCLCPSNWSECTGLGQVGAGTSCVEKNKTKYAYCSCQSPYNYLCTGEGATYTEKGSGSYCENTMTGFRYYASCTEVCREGYNKGAQDWWSSCGRAQCLSELEGSTSEPEGSNCTYTRTTKPTGCSSAASCTKNGITYYANSCTACVSGYTLSNGVCTPNSSGTCPMGYTQSSTISNCDLHINAKGCYQCSQCKLGYTLNDYGGCYKNGDAVKLVYYVTSSNYSANFELIGDATIDWGDGQISTCHGENYENGYADSRAYERNCEEPSTSYCSHTYAQPGSYTVNITGTPYGLHYFDGCQIAEFKEISLPSIKRIDWLFGNGSLGWKCYENSNNPPVSISNIVLGSGITHACGVFSGGNLKGPIPTLPASLQYADYMFQDWGGDSWSIDKDPDTLPALPRGLISAEDMFDWGENDWTGSIPTLPDTLQNGSYMFNKCYGLTGTVTSLPRSLQNGSWMFGDTPNLSGTCPTRPASLTDFRGMFAGSGISCSYGK